MKRLLLLAVAGLALLGGCAELDDTVSVQPGPHPADWATPGAEGNHASALEANGLPNSTMSCGRCHGMDYGKAARAEDHTECFVCHQTGGLVGHPTSGFIPPSGDEFHGRMVVEGGGTDRCAHCHAWETDGGLDFDQGGWAQQDCSPCHGGGRSGHPANDVWLNPASPGFHGNAAAGGMVTDCVRCHGENYLGGWTESSCSDCHGKEAPKVPIHPAGWVGSRDTEGTHAWYLYRVEIRTTDCRGCHGEPDEQFYPQFSGGWANQTCQPCHG